MYSPVHVNVDEESTEILIVQSKINSVAYKWVLPHR